MYQHVSTCFKVYQGVSRCIKVYQDVSRCIKVYRLLPGRISLVRYDVDTVVHTFNMRWVVAKTCEQMPIFRYPLQEHMSVNGLASHSTQTDKSGADWTMTRQLHNSVNAFMLQFFVGHSPAQARSYLRISRRITQYQCASTYIIVYQVQSVHEGVIC